MIKKEDYLETKEEAFDLARELATEIVSNDNDLNELIVDDLDKRIHNNFRVQIAHWNHFNNLNDLDYKYMNRIFPFLKNMKSMKIGFKERMRFFDIKMLYYMTREQACENRLMDVWKEEHPLHTGLLKVRMRFCNSDGLMRYLPKSCIPLNVNLDYDHDFNFGIFHSYPDYLAALNLNKKQSKLLREREREYFGSRKFIDYLDNMMTKHYFTKEAYEFQIKRNQKLEKEHYNLGKFKMQYPSGRIYENTFQGHIPGFLINGMYADALIFERKLKREHFDKFIKLIKFAHSLYKEKQVYKRFKNLYDEGKIEIPWLKR